MMNEMYLFALEIAKQAGKMSIDLRKQPLNLEMKSSHADLVTFVDKEIEKFVVDSILEKYPNHGILGEEGTFKKDINNYETIWIVDPIDGTSNFIHQQQHYAISIGIAVNKEILFGVVYDPIMDELFYAEKGKGAYLNNIKILKLENKVIQESLISTCMFWQDPKTKTDLNKGIIQLAKQSRGIRMLASAALDMCYVCVGRLDAYINPAIKPWDYAAGKIIAEEAGAIVTRINGNEVDSLNGGSILASNAGIHATLKEYFN